mmetsp:Transcript_4967/g.9328  ORF Transcript_4967/g.9328 Transcript_4967/m.9328 type:complete len:385 (-) Transcript_4967:171-1325(-)
MALYCKSAQVTRAEFQSEPKCRDQSMKASRKPGFRMGGKVQSSCIKERTRIFGLVVNPPLNRSTVHTVSSGRRRELDVQMRISSDYLHYVEPVFRPPAEVQSTILQITNGCSWNRCTFCEMYTQPQKKFRAKPLQEVERELVLLGEAARDAQRPHARVFLADGDAMTLPFEHLKAICKMIKLHMPEVSRISSYCLPRNIHGKTVEQLRELKSLGMSILYVGCESGDDEVLRRVNKGETLESSAEALQKIRASGLKSSVMILNGLGGRELSKQHAENSARLVNAGQPNYLSTLVVSFPMGMERYQEGWGDEPFVALSQVELFQEMETFVEHLNLEKTIFRSDHASNYLVLKGVLGRDKQRLLSHVRKAIEDPHGINLRPEWMRGL